MSQTDESDIELKTRFGGRCSFCIKASTSPRDIPRLTERSLQATTKSADHSVKWIDDEGILYNFVTTRA
ncbi:unnamed protein product, partial [Mesorhabditis belari]|uniref:Uncharacterized protein n=1 Tax=Mesorhabditis belari TaxID=2138241 RepID=A0AAF3ER27_9BILA